MTSREKLPQTNEQKLIHSLKPLRKFFLLKMDYVLQKVKLMAQMSLVKSRLVPGRK